MERDELDQIERVINHELRTRFLAGAVERAVLLQHGDDPAIEPGESAGAGVHPGAGSA